MWPRKGTLLVSGLTLAALSLLAAPVRAHDYGNVFVAPGLEVTQSIQTSPQVPSATGIGLSAHKPTEIRAYLQANRYVHLNLGFFTIHFPSFNPVTVDGTLTVKQGAVTIATLPATNGPVALTPWTSPIFDNANSSLNFAMTFPPSGTVTFELSLTTSTPGVTVTNPAPASRTFEHNQRLRIQAVKLEFDHDNNPVTPPTKSPSPAMVADGKDWFLKSGPLAPCKLLYWVNPTPLQVTTDLSVTSSGALLSTLAGMQVQGSTTYDNVFGWWQGGVSGNGLATVPACAAAHAAGAYGNTDPVRYQRTFTHELYHNYWQDHLADGIANSTCDAHPGPDTGTGQIGVVGWDTSLSTPVPANRLDVMVPGQVTSAAWQSPNRYSLFWNLWSPAFESFFDACHFDWWIDRPILFEPFGLEPPVVIDPIRLGFINGIIDPTKIGRLWPSWELVRSLPPSPITREGSFSAQLIDLKGEVIDERRFEPDFEGDSARDARQPAPASFAFLMPVPFDSTGRRNVSEVRLVHDAEVLDRIPVTPNAPRLQILAPQPKEQPILKDRFELQWEASDPDPGPRGLYFAVQYSPDGGQHFLALANNIWGRTSYPFDPGKLPGGSTVLFRVMATDGFNTTEADIGPFEVPRKAPTVEIVSPPADPMTVVGAEKSLTLMGTGDSPDDGVLPGPRLKWSSDVQGDLGEGYTLEVRLKPGRHLVTLTGTDRADVPATAQVSVEVLPPGQDTDKDGTPDYADRCPNDPGPPANQGCPYDAATLPLDVKVTVQNKMGNPQDIFDHAQDVFFDVLIKNPRAGPVSLAFHRLTMTDPNGGVFTMDVPEALTLGPGESSSRNVSFFDVFGTLSLPNGPYSVVFEPNDAGRQPVGHAVAAFAVDPSLRHELCVGSATGSPGTRVSIPITLNNGAGVAGFQVDVGYDPAAVSVVGVRLGADTAAAGGWQVNMAPIGAGMVRVLGDSSPPAGLGAGPKQVAILDFTIAAGLPAGTSPLALTNCVLSDPSGLELHCSLCPQPGVIRIQLVRSFTFQPLPSPVGVDKFDPQAFSAAARALDTAGNLAVGYNMAASIQIPDGLCAGTLRPATMSFVGGLGGPDTHQAFCCVDPILPATVTPLSLELTDPGGGVSSTSDSFRGVAKGDLNASNSVDVLDVTRTVRLALNLSVPEPPNTAFQTWAANMLDQRCMVDGVINVLDVVRVRNKALLRPSLCPCGPTLRENQALPSEVTRPLMIRLVRVGGKVRVQVASALDLSGIQIELRAFGARAAVKPAGLAAGWSVSSSRDGRKLRIIAHSPASTGISGNGVLLELSRAVGVKLLKVVASDTGGRELPVQMTP
jgi:hypothetical protein